MTGDRLQEVCEIIPEYAIKLVKNLWQFIVILNFGNFIKLCSYCYRLAEKLEGK